MATFVEHIACKSCGSSDARAVYSDGGEYCFSCGASSRADRPGFSVSTDEKSFILPRDLVQEYPEAVFKWIQPTGLEAHDLIRNGYFYSKFTRGLYRALGREFYQKRGQELGHDGSAWDIRWGLESTLPSFGAKSQFLGSKEEASGAVQLSPSGSTTGLIVVEDSLSAIKCARLMDSIPLFGSTISNDKLTRITKGYERVYIWLDSDKYKNAQAIAIKCQLLGKQAQCIYTEVDPKYLNAKDVINA